MIRVEAIGRKIYLVSEDYVNEVTIDNCEHLINELYISIQIIKNNFKNEHPQRQLSNSGRYENKQESVIA